MEGSDKNMKKKITVFALCAMLLALYVSAQAQQPGKDPADRISAVERRCQ